MKVDAPGLVAAAQRLAGAVVDALGAGSGLPHPPLGADPASVGAAERLSTAGAELAAGLAGHVSALVASLEHLAGVTVSFTETDAGNADLLATLTGAASGPAPAAGSAPPPPPLAPDVRAPLPPAAGLQPEALSAGAHTGDIAAGEPFTAAWSGAGAAARATAEQVRAAVGALPETLDGPVSTPAASRHLLAFADGLDEYADRGHALARQASTYAGDLAHARTQIPTPQQLADAHQRVLAYAQANAASGGAYAAPLAQAMSARNELQAAALAGYSGYHANVDTTTGDGASAGGQGASPVAADGAAAAAEGDPAASGPAVSDPGSDLGADSLTAGQPGLNDPLTATPAGSAGELAGMLPQMIPTVLGAAGGLIGGLLGAATQAPEALLQAGTQAISAATQGLSARGGLGAGEFGGLEPGDMPGGVGSGGGGGEPGLGDGGMGGLGDLGGGGGGATTPAGGDGAPSLAVGATTGAPPTPAVLPVGAAGPPPPAASAGMSGMPMGMPMGGMGGMAGGAGAGGEGRSERARTVKSRPVPHTEDITGRVDTNRLSAAAAANRAIKAEEPPTPPSDDGPAATAPAQPIVVRRLTTRPPQEPT